jgi:hypothetical protein
VLVNSMIRLPGVSFERVIGRAAAERKHLLSELWHNKLEACCELLARPLKLNL